MRYFWAKVYFKSWELILNEPVPEVVEFRTADWAVQREDCGDFQTKNSTKPMKSQALTWELGTNNIPFIFSADLLKVYRKFL